MQCQPTCCTRWSAKIFVILLAVLSIALTVVLFFTTEENTDLEFLISISVWTFLELFVLLVVLVEHRILLLIGFFVSALLLFIFVINFVSASVIEVIYWINPPEETTTKATEATTTTQKDASTTEAEEVTVGDIVAAEVIQLGFVALYFVQTICVWLLYKWFRTPREPKPMSSRF